MLVTNQWNLRFSVSDGILVSYGMKEKTRNQALVACIVAIFVSFNFHDCRARGQWLQPSQGLLTDEFLFS